MHATTEQLLSLRDGEAVAELVARHVQSCPACSRELARLEAIREQLRALPELDPPADLWRVVATDTLRSGGRRPVPWAPVFAVAASFVLALAMILSFGARTPDRPEPGTTTDLVASTPAPLSSVNGVSTSELLETSRRLETALHALPAAPRVTRASTALTIAELQDSIFEIDAELSQRGLEPAREQALWRQRVDLMDALMQVRYAELVESQ